MKLHEYRYLCARPAGTIRTSYFDIVAKLGFQPNVTDIFDTDEVKAAWSFKVDNGDTATVYCYHVDDPLACPLWSANGSYPLLKEVFGETFEPSDDPHSKKEIVKHVDPNEKFIAGAFYTRALIAAELNETLGKHRAVCDLEDMFKINDARLGSLDCGEYSCKVNAILTDRETYPDLDDVHAACEKVRYDWLVKLGLLKKPASNAVFKVTISSNPHLFGEMDTYPTSIGAVMLDVSVHVKGMLARCTPGTITIAINPAAVDGTVRRHMAGSEHAVVRR